MIIYVLRLFIGIWSRCFCGFFIGFYEILDQFNYLFFNYGHKIDSTIFFEDLETNTKHLPQSNARILTYKQNKIQQKCLKITHPNQTLLPISWKYLSISPEKDLKNNDNLIYLKVD